MTSSDLINDMKEDLDRLVTWSERHDERHRSDDRRVDIVLGLLARQKADLHSHDENHHGTATAMKRDGLVVMAVSVLYGLVEVFRAVGFPF